MFHLSFLPSGTITSLNSGLPSRETCTHGPDCERSSLALSIMRTLRRLAALHTPITDELLPAFFGTEPCGVRCEIGTCSAIVWMLSVLVASTPAASALGIRCRCWNGRRSARSKIAPRST